MARSPRPDHRPEKPPSSTPLEAAAGQHGRVASSRCLAFGADEDKASLVGATREAMVQTLAGLRQVGLLDFEKNPAILKEVREG